MKRFFCLLAFLGGIVLPVSSAQAQNMRLVHLSWNSLGMAGMRGLGGAANNERYRLSQFGASFMAPIPLVDKQTYLAPGLRYSGLFSREELTGSTGIHDLHQLGISALLIHRFTKDLMLLARAEGILAMAPESAQDDYLKGSALAMLRYRLMPGLGAGLGILVNQGLQQTNVLPAVAVRWQITDKTRLNLFLPSFARIVHQFSPRFELGVATNIFGTELIPADNRYIDNAQHVSIDAGVQAGVRLYESLWFTFYGGSTVHQWYELNSSHEHIHGRRIDSENRWVLRSGLAWRLGGRKK